MTEQVKNHYLALPETGKGAGVLVLHAWWGLNGFFRDFCDRLAQEGFVALAPDLYHGKIAHTIEEADQLSSDLKMAQAAEDIQAALKVLSGISKAAEKGLGTIGFSMGANLALWLAHEKPENIRAVTLFYGSGEGDFTSSKAAFLGHFAENDPYETEAGVKELERNLRSANRPVTFYTYPGTGHWFFEQDRPDAFKPQAAQLAWERTVDFLHRTLDSAASGKA
jgi:carboxymethylenebutenolidase